MIRQNKEISVLKACLGIIVIVSMSCQASSNDSSTVETGCYPGEPCIEYQDPGGPPGDTGVGDPICLLSPTGDVPLKTTQSYSAAHKAHDVVGAKIKAPFDGIIRSEFGIYGSWGCYSSGLCYGSKTCQCLLDVDMKHHITQCDDKITNHYYSGGSYSYAKGAPCYSEMCNSDMCQHPERPCHNQITLESTDGLYRFRALHINKLLVKTGDTVTAGTEIAEIGNTGWSCSSTEAGMGVHGHLNLYEKYTDKETNKEVWGLVTDWPTWISKNCDSQASCGNGKCEVGENCKTCIQDCACMGGLSCINNVCTMAACTEGSRERCWVECQQVYSAGCFNTDTPVRLMGIRSCTAGKWNDCVTKEQCTKYAGVCPNGTSQTLSFECIDGNQKTGKAPCGRPLGGMCVNSYYSGYGYLDCPDLCLGSGDACAVEGQTRACEVHCNTPLGPIRAGMQTCQPADCSGIRVRYWADCKTNDGCLK